MGFLALVLPAAAQFAGPAILTRGEAPAAMGKPQIDFRPFAAISGGFSSGLAGVGVSETGDFPNYSSATINASWGVSGIHSWRRTKLGLDYSGSVSHYFNQGRFDSLNHSLSLGINEQISRHVVLSIAERAGVFSRDNGLRGLQQSVPFDPSTSFVPTQDYFDNRTLYQSSQAQLAVQRSVKTSISLGGGFFTTSYRSKALNGVTGYNATGDIQHRMTRRLTVGSSYSYGHYNFRRVFGGTDFHAVAGTLAIALTRTLEFSGYGGVARVESKFTRSIPLDPAIVALLGITSGKEVVHSVQFIPNAGARLSRAFQTGVLSISVGHGIVPGNGLFLTSYSTNLIGNYGYTGLRRWSFDAYVQYTHSTAIGDVAGSYGSTTGGLSVSRKITGPLHFLLTGSERRYGSASFSNYNRNVTDIRIGFGFTPGDIPLRVW